MDEWTQLKACIDVSIPHVAPAAADIVREWFGKDELELAFEALVLGLIEAGAPPPGGAFADWERLARALGAREESVLADDFWDRFEAWGRAAT